jgi:hypothetical protein
LGKHFPDIRRKVMDVYVARASGAAGYDILDPEGEVVAWTVNGWWASVIVDLLNDAEVQAPCLLAALHEAAGNPFAPE